MRSRGPPEPFQDTHAIVPEPVRHVVVGLDEISSRITSCLMADAADECRIASGDVGDNAGFARGANLPETFADAGGSRHEGLRLNKKSRFKLINWHTGEPVVSFQPSFSFTSK